MKQPSFDQFAEMVDQALERIPSRFCAGLNGGFNLLEEKKTDGPFHVMGEYIEDEQMGCFIVLYYGSFAQVLQDESWRGWQTEIMETVLHELQHHREAMAGLDDLARQEIEELAKELQNGSDK